MAEYKLVLEGLSPFRVEMIPPAGLLSMLRFPTEVAALMWIAEQVTYDENAEIARIPRTPQASPAERSAAYRARRKATVAATPTKPPVVVRYRRPADRRSRPQQWADAVHTLADLLDRFQEWRDTPPPSPTSATAEALDAVLELRGYVEELQAVELPKGFGRD